MTRKGWIAVGGSLALSCVLAIALVVAIALGGDDDSTVDPPAPAAESSLPPEELGAQAELPAEVEECLAEKGVELPEPGEALSGGFDIEALRGALEECGLDPPEQAQPFNPG
jgi:hypothetical protein